jgi:DNA-binding beta-propeller fold protein YncE
LLPGGRYLWVADRSANRIHVVDTRTDNVVGGVDLLNGLSPDPMADLLDTSPTGDRVFASLRGPTPLTGNAAGHDNAVGKSPGVGVIRVDQNGRTGVLQAIAPISHIVNEVNVADPHGLRVRRKGLR